jgi:DNA polymerase/3'-5' exonuclease PolX
LSTGEKMPLAVARLVAGEIAQRLEKSGTFDRVLIAGSVRRERSQVGDVEIVARVANPDEFGLESALAAAFRAGGLRRPQVPEGARASPWGDRYRKAQYSRDGTERIPVDVFMVRPPADWGVIAAIRTGSAEFSQFVVTRLHAFGLRTEDGRVVQISDPDVRHPELACPEEADFFRLAGLKEPPPAFREVPVDPSFILNP